MRNGNLPATMALQAEDFRSYRTYEEWKPIYVKDADNGVVGSYRTYEEWKLSHVWPRHLPDTRSYRTYEEWKHRYQIFSCIMLTTVLTVPMRNGNKATQK